MWVYSGVSSGVGQVTMWVMGMATWWVAARWVAWRDGSRTHGRGEWVLMGGFRWGLGWFPSLGFFFSPLCLISLVVFDVRFAFGFV